MERVLAQVLARRFYNESPSDAPSGLGGCSQATPPRSTSERTATVEPQIFPRPFVAHLRAGPPARPTSAIDEAEARLVREILAENSPDETIEGLLVGGFADEKRLHADGARRLQSKDTLTCVCVCDMDM